MLYVDGFVVAVPKKKLKAYAKLSKMAGKVWREHGALDYRELDAALPAPLRVRGSAYT